MLIALSFFIALVLILLNGFFVLAEFAFVKVRYTQLEELVRRGDVRAEIAKKIAADLDNYLSAIQLGITMASLGLGWVGEPSVGKFVQIIMPSLAPGISVTVSHTISFVLAFAVITSMHVVIGEQVPKLIAIKKPAQMALFISYPLRVFHAITYLPMRLLNGTAYAVLTAIGFKPKEKEEAHSEDELRLILGETQEEGSLSLGRLLMFENLFDFGHSSVKTMMTPRDSVAYLSTAKSWAENFEVIKQRRFTRYPLCRDGLDNALGYVHLKDLAISAMSGHSEPELEKARRRILTISEDLPAEKALREFQDNRLHLALVVNKNSQITGLLTLEDVIEELIGEIRDEAEVKTVSTLRENFTADATILELGSQDNLVCIQQLLKKLNAAHPVFDYDEALKLILSREKSFSTALGNGVAFPHARVQNLSKPLIAFGRNTEPINFLSLDKKPVHIIFLILTPFYDPSYQLKILSQLSMLVGNQTLHRKLLHAKAPAEIEEIIHIFENRVPEG